jgi:hypothetical protein
MAGVVGCVPPSLPPVAIAHALLAQRRHGTRPRDSFFFLLHPSSNTLSPRVRREEGRIHGGERPTAERSSLCLALAC